MEVLKFDLEVPFWCSFKHFGTVNIQQTYPFPPPPTIFGMIQNALGKTQKPFANQSRDYRGYNKLSFAIVIRDPGEKLDDYANIMKGNRARNKSRESLEDNLKSELKKLRKELKERGLSEDDIENQLSDYEENFWNDKIKKIGRYEIDKKWMRTQVTRQRLINPKYTICIKSGDSDEYSLKNISAALKNPKRPLYIGENDDFVIIRLKGNGIFEATSDIESKQIKSVIPGIHENSEIVKIPVAIKGDKTKLVVSIPKGELRNPVPCINVDGENIVFLQ